MKQQKFILTKSAKKSCVNLHPTGSINKVYMYNFRKQKATNVQNSQEIDLHQFVAVMNEMPTR